jgi:hypothetical protein
MAAVLTSEGRDKSTMIIKKIFALASVTALTGVVSAVAASGCSSTTVVANAPDGAGTAAIGAKCTSPSDCASGSCKAGKCAVEEAGAPIEASVEDASGPPEEGTVGKICDTNADCSVPNAKNDNKCSKGAFTAGDLFSSPICYQRTCTQGTGGTVADLLCDGEAGLCLPTSATGNTGICLPLCEFDSTKVVTPCQGGNKCAIAYSATNTKNEVSAIGTCGGACQADADCKGTAGQICQVETGLCVNADTPKFVKAYGEGCDGSKSAPADCNCNAVGGTTANKDKGVCTRACVTGAAGDTACNAAVAGWKCTARLPVVDSNNKPAFTAQPNDIRGQCALPCTDDVICQPLQTSTGAPMKCKDFAGGKFCETAE